MLSVISLVDDADLCHILRQAANEHRIPILHVRIEQSQQSQNMSASSLQQQKSDKKLCWLSKIFTIAHHTQSSSFD